MQVYKPASKPATERDGRLAPYTQQAEFMARAEAAVQAVAGLPWVIVRPAGGQQEGRVQPLQRCCCQPYCCCCCPHFRAPVCYGPGDVNGIMPRCVVAAAYVKMGAKVREGWGDDGGEEEGRILSTSPRPSSHRQMEFMWDGDLKVRERDKMRRALTSRLPCPSLPPHR